VDPETGYVALPEPVSVTVQSGDIKTDVDFAVRAIDSAIRGQVFAPDGTGLHAFVYAQGESPIIGYYETYTETRADGSFDLPVPEGVYVVGAGLPDEELADKDWLSPPVIENVVARAGEPVENLALRFRRLDGAIHGTLTFTPSVLVTPTHAAYVWGWSESGEWAETEAVFGSDTATYTLNVVSGTVWHVGAVYEDWDNGLYYESAEAIVPVAPPTGQATQDLVLDGPWTLPQPVVVSFDGSQMQTIVLSGGLELRIPAGALVVSGTVTLYIFPTRELRPEAGHEVIGAGYEIWAADANGQEITYFNKRVVMTFPYPPDGVLAAIPLPQPGAYRLVAQLAEAQGRVHQGLPKPVGAPTPERISTEEVSILGVKGLLTNLARCCKPVPGDPIIGYITRGRGATIHRIDCPNVLRIKDKERLVQVSWGQAKETYPVLIRIRAYDRDGLMRDVSTLVANEGINRSYIHVSTKNSLAIFDLEMGIADVSQLSRLLNRIEALPNVLEARRLRPG
jgi:hypothetical protein